ncbi:hypothetical protein GCM10027288_15770 [Bordetella tumbae]
MWRANGKAPPKALNPNQKNPLNRAQQVGGGESDVGDTAVEDEVFIKIPAEIGTR